jgi:heme exporter protein B
MSVLAALLRKDVLLELRRKETLIAVFFFAFLVLVLFFFAFSPGGSTREQRLELAPGILWIAFAFAAVIGLNRVFDKERQNQCLQGLLLAPVPVSMLYVSKFLSNLIFLVLIESALLPLFIILFDVPIRPRLGLIFPVMVLGTVGFLAIGTLFGAVTMRVHGRELLLPLLIFPVTIPVLIVAVESTALLIGPWRSEVFWRLSAFLAGMDLLFLLAGVLLFPAAVRQR